MKLIALFAVALTLYSFASAAKCRRNYPFRLLEDTASDSRGLARVIAKYRALLGGEDNESTPGPLKNGHRSINWDAGVVPGVPDFMPPNFFNKNAPRGLEFQTRRNLFSVSNPKNETDSKVDNRFSSFNPIFPTIFKTFSATRLFAPTFATWFSGHFFVPDTQIRAEVSGFGAVFTDVDVVRKTCISYFDRFGCRLATVCAKPRSRGLSFVGVKFLRNKVARIRVTLGNKAISDKGAGNFVVVDDLIYGEPQAIRR